MSTRKLKVAIVGSGNIGTDLMIKVLRNSQYLEMGAMVGIDPASDGLARASRMGVATTHEGVEGLTRLPVFSEIDFVFDATSASAHVKNDAFLRGHKPGIRMIDLTPAAIGPYCVPVVNLEEHLGKTNVNMVTCGGQATIPMVAAVSRVAKVHYAEIVASIASKSAGPGNGLLEDRVRDILASGQGIEAQMQASRASLARLGQCGDGLLEQSFQFRLGVRDPCEARIECILRYRDRLQTLLRILAEEGHDIWDQQYRAVPGTDPQRYSTGYTDRFEKLVQPLYDQAVAEIAGAVFMAAADLRGYTPTQTRALARPLTGDPRRDATGNFTRLFHNTSELERRALQSEAPLLVQTYARKAGQVLLDVSVPLFVDGRRWGALRCGFDPLGQEAPGQDDVTGVLAAI